MNPPPTEDQTMTTYSDTAPTSAPTSANEVHLHPVTLEWSQRIPGTRRHRTVSQRHVVANVARRDGERFVWVEAGWAPTEEGAEKIAAIFMSMQERSFPSTAARIEATFAAIEAA